MVEVLSQMEIAVPWRELVTEIEPFYPKPGNGPPPVRLDQWGGVGAADVLVGFDLRQPNDAVILQTPNAEKSE